MLSPFSPCTPLSYFQFMMGHSAFLVRASGFFSTAFFSAQFFPLNWCGVIDQRDDDRGLRFGTGFVQHGATLGEHRVCSMVIAFCSRISILEWRTHDPAAHKDVEVRRVIRDKSPSIFNNRSCSCFVGLLLGLAGEF